MELNDSQKMAVKSTAPVVSVVAGAGSGKTRVLVSSIQNLIDKGIDPCSVLAITFTNKAARELRERLDEDRITACTIHSWCLKIIRKYRRNVTIWDEDDVARAMKVVLGRLGITTKEIDFKGLIALNLDKMIPLKPPVSSIYIAYRQYMERCNAVDFTHMLQYTYEILQDPTARQATRERYPYVLVDEYQDVSKLQHEIIKLIRSNYLFVVGDNWQSIYGFRGGSPDYIDEWFNMKESEKITLDTNYRNPSKVNYRANQLMGFQRVRKCTNNDGDVKANYFRDEFDEAEFVANVIKRMPGEERNNTAVLYRTNMYANTLTKQLYRMGIPFIMKGQEVLFKRKVVKDILAYLRLSINNEDDISFLRIVNVPKRGIGDAKIERITQKSPMMENAFEIYPTLLVDFKILLDRIRQVSYTAYKIEIIADALSPDDPALIEELLEIAHEYPNVNEFLDLVMTFEDRDAKKLKLMTIHASKGLEFKNVFIIGSNQGILPHFKGNPAEERRMMYVALTRGINNVVITGVAWKKTSFLNDFISKEEWRQLVKGA